MRDAKAEGRASEAKLGRYFLMEESMHKMIKEFLDKPKPELEDAWGTGQKPYCSSYPT